MARKNIDERREYEKNYRKTHRKEIREYRREYLVKLKREIFDLLGNKCVFCGYTGLALQIDHVNSGGCKERKRYGENTMYFYAHVLKEIKLGSQEYQLLCANCNFIKRLTSKKENKERI